MSSDQWRPEASRRYTLLQVTLFFQTERLLNSCGSVLYWAMRVLSISAQCEPVTCLRPPTAAEYGVRLYMLVICLPSPPCELRLREVFVDLGRTEQVMYLKWNAENTHFPLVHQALVGAYDHESPIHPHPPPPTPSQNGAGDNMLLWQQESFAIIPLVQWNMFWELQGGRFKRS